MIRARLLPLVIVAAGTTMAAQPVQPAVPLDAVDGIVQAFKTHNVVMLPGGHGSKPLHDLLLRVLRDPRIQGTVNDVVVEFGTSRYQDLIDRYTRGDALPAAAIRRAWQDTTTPGVTHDNVFVEDFYSEVRTLNAGLRKEQRYRVLGGDPPIDWDNVVSAADVRRWTVRRDTFAADLIHREVVERGRRALVVYGHLHFPRKEVMANYDMSNWQAQTMTSLLERVPGAAVFVIWAEGTPAVATLQPDMTSWPPLSLALVRGTALGAADFTVFNGDKGRFAIRGVDDFVAIPKDQYKKMRMEEMVDAILWNPNAAPKPIQLSAATCADPAYVPMRLHRIAVAGLPPAEADAVKRACGVKH